MLDQDLFRIHAFLLVEKLTIQTLDSMNLILPCEDN